MFNLNDNHVYTWHHLFLLLSLERSALFLSEIDFPVEEHIISIRETSRGFVKRFYEVEQQLFANQKISSIGIDLFNSTYVSLSEKIGSSATAIFCKWGNDLLIDMPFERTLFRLWEDVFLKIISDKEKLELPEANRKKFCWIKAIVIHTNAELVGIADALDALDLAPKDDWDLEAYRIYNEGDRRNLSEVQINLSPLEYFDGVARYVKIYRAICLVKSLFTDNELATLLDWIDSLLTIKLEIKTETVFQSCG